MILIIPDIHLKPWMFAAAERIMQDMWNNDSPIWLRPQREYCRGVIQMYKPRTFLQVVGHTPMKEITREGNILSCDVFSTHRDRTPYGSQKFCLLGTKTWEWIELSAEGAAL